MPLDVASELAGPAARPRVNTPEDVRALVASGADPELLGALRDHLRAMLAALPTPLEEDGVSYVQLAMREVAAEANQPGASAPHDPEAESMCVIYELEAYDGSTAEVYAYASGDRLTQTHERITKMAAKWGWAIAGWQTISFDSDEPASEAGAEKIDRAELRRELEALKAEMRLPYATARRIK